MNSGKHFDSSIWRCKGSFDTDPHMAVSRIKSLLAYSGYYSGLLGLLQWVRSRNGALILMYHRIMPQDRNPDVQVQPGMYVSTKTFNRHLRFLKKRFSVVSLRDLVAGLENGKDVRGCCALTFDDGWRDNFQFAFSLLQKHQFPATVFLATGYIGTSRWFWPEEVAWSVARILQGKMRMAALPDPIGELVSGAVHANPAMAESIIDRVIESMKRYPPARRREILDMLRSSNPDHEKRERLLMNWDEVREMATGSLVDFGSHTENHTLLDQQPLQRVKAEIVSSRQRIESEINRPVTFLAYPNGNYTPQILDVLGELGIDAALTTRRGYAGPASPLLELPRIAIHEDVGCSSALFLWRILVQ